MQDFLSKMGKYEAAMSPFANRKSVRSAGKKAEYAVFMSEEVKTMRAMISGKVISINLLLGTHASETLSRTEGQLSANQENLLARLAEAKNGMNSIRQDIASMNTATSTSQEQLREDILNSTSHLTDQLGQVNNDTASTKRNISALATGVGSISTSITTLLGLGTQILSILRVFPAELRALLQNVVRTNVQMYAVLLEVQRKISASPTLALESNIRIEDALGEIRSLPYEWFRHWEVRKSGRIYASVAKLNSHSRASFVPSSRTDWDLNESKEANSVSYIQNSQLFRWMKTTGRGP